MVPFGPWQVLWHLLPVYSVAEQDMPRSVPEHQILIHWYLLFQNLFIYGSLIARTTAHLTLVHFISKFFFRFFLLLFELFITPHSSLDIVPDILAVRINTGHRNSIMYKMATMRVLQVWLCGQGFVPRPIMKKNCLSTFWGTLAGKSALAKLWSLFMKFVA